MQPGPKRRCASAAAWKMASSPAVSSPYSTPGRAQRPVVAQFGRQQRHPSLLVQGEVVRLHPGAREQLGHRALVDRRVLAQVEGGAVKAEHLQMADQPAQRAAAGHRLRPLRQRMGEHRQVAAQLVRPGIGLGRQARRARRRAADQRRIGRRRARIEAADRPAVGFVRPRGRVVAARLGQRQHGVRHVRQLGRYRQFAPQLVQPIERAAQRRLRPARQGHRQRVGGHERVAVAVAADPAADPQERRWPLAQHRLPPRVKRRAAPASARRARRRAHCPPRRRPPAFRGAAGGSATAGSPGA